jgi:ABC-type transport system involved in multi-copper enzyme maturation permease subunit
MIKKKKRPFQSTFTQNLFSIFVITKHEFKYNLISWRMGVILIIFAFGTIGSAYGLSYLIIEEQQEVLTVNYEEPEEVLLGVAAFVSYLGSLMAIIFAFDSITRERIQGSMDFLLTRPVSKRGIILGKFLGLWLAILIPVSLVMGICVIVVSYMIHLPEVSTTVSFFLLTALFIGTYISFQQIFSSMAKSITEALITGILVFMLYTMFWMLFPYGCGYILGMDLAFSEPTENLRILIDTYNLFNPNGAYQSALSGMVNPDFVDGMHHTVPFYALVAWFIGTLLVNIEVFNRKA